MIQQYILGDNGNVFDNSGNMFSYFSGFPLGMKLWLRADANYVKDENNKVSEWNDSSGNGNNVLQDTEANQPLWVDDGLNDKPVLRFNGSTTFLNGGNIMNLGLQSHTFFTVGKVTSGEDGTFYAKIIAAGSESRYAFSRINNSIRSLYTDNTNRHIATPQPLGETSLYRTVINREDNTHTFAIDGNTVDSIAISETHSMSSNYLFLVGAYNNSSGGVPPLSGYYLNGDIAEIIIFSQALSNAQIQSVENYLTSKYAL